MTKRFLLSQKIGSIPIKVAPLILVSLLSTDCLASVSLTDESIIEVAQENLNQKYFDDLLESGHITMFDNFSFSTSEMIETVDFLKLVTPNFLRLNTYIQFALVDVALFAGFASTIINHSDFILDCGESNIDEIIGHLEYFKNIYDINPDRLDVHKKYLNYLKLLKL